MRWSKPLSANESSRSLVRVNRRKLGERSVIRETRQVWRWKGEVGD